MKAAYIFLGVIGVSIAGVIILLMIIAGYILGTLNTEAESKNLVAAEVKVIEAHFDKMWKVIEQKTQITKASAQLQKDLVKTLIEGRSGSFIKIVGEQNPQTAFSLEQFNSLSNAVESQREGFFREQEKAQILVKNNHVMFDQQPCGFVLNLFGRKPVDDIQVISSTVTKGVIESGKDDNVKLEL